MMMMMIIIIIIIIIIITIIIIIHQFSIIDPTTDINNLPLNRTRI
jgi:hypothetical protein